MHNSSQIIQKNLSRVIITYVPKEYGIKINNEKEVLEISIFTVVIDIKGNAQTTSQMT